MRSPRIDRRSVLVIEDDTLNLRIFSAMIAAQGHHVLQATSAADGLDLAYRQRPDLIIMDVRLPDMSGLDATRRLKSREVTRDIPVIITTAYLVTEEELRDSGCDGYLAKPISVSEFVETIETFMARSAVPDYAD